MNKAFNKASHKKEVHSLYLPVWHVTRKKAKVGRLLASAPAGVVGMPRSTLTKETKRFGFVSNKIWKHCNIVLYYGKEKLHRSK